MKSRLTAWLAALLLMSAVFGVPVTRVATNRVACYQVYSEKERHRPEQFSEAVEPPPPAPPVLAAAALPAALPSAALDYSLFQRPPPAASFARL